MLTLLHCYISCPAISCPVIWSIKFMSVIFSIPPEFLVQVSWLCVISITVLKHIVGIPLREITILSVRNSGCNRHLCLLFLCCSINKHRTSQLHNGKLNFVFYPCAMCAYVCMSACAITNACMYVLLLSQWCFVIHLPVLNKRQTRHVSNGSVDCWVSYFVYFTKYKCEDYGDYPIFFLFLILISDSLRFSLVQCLRGDFVISDTIIVITLDIRH